MTRLVAMPNTVEEAEQAAMTMTLALVPLAVHLCMVEEAVAQDAVMVERVQQEPVVHGEVIPQVAGVLAEVVMPMLVTPEHPENLGLAMVEVAENPTEQVEEMAEPRLAVAVEAEGQLIQVQQAELEPEAR
jgi:hypothetical protein